MNINEIKAILLEKYPHGDIDHLDKYIEIVSNPVGKGYTEAHHILPKHEFPEFKKFSLHKWNKVVISYVEHIICHWHYAKFCNTNESMAAVQQLMQVKALHLADTTDEQLIQLRDIANYLKNNRDWKSELLTAAKGKARDENSTAGPHPMWIDIVNKAVVLNEYAETVKQMIQMRLRGCSVSEIHDTTGVNRATVRAQLNNPAIKGTKEFRSQGKVLKTVENFYPALCTEEEFATLKSGKIPRGKKSTSLHYTNYKRTVEWYKLWCKANKPKCGKLRTLLRNNGVDMTYNQTQGLINRAFPSIEEKEKFDDVELVVDLNIVNMCKANYKPVDTPVKLAA